MVVLALAYGLTAEASTLCGVFESNEEAVGGQIEAGGVVFLLGLLCLVAGGVAARIRPQQHWQILGVAAVSYCAALVGVWFLAPSIWGPQRCETPAPKQAHPTPILVGTLSTATSGGAENAWRRLRTA